MHPNKKHISLAAFFINLLMALFSSHTVLAEDKIITIESTITGSQEQPTILVIVPWKKPEAVTSIEPSIKEADNNLFLQPLERKSFLHKTRLLEDIIDNNTP